MHVTNIKNVTLADFFLRPKESLEHIFGCENIQRELEIVGPHEAARLWQRCDYFALNPLMENLNEDALHDIAFSVMFTMSVSKLETSGNLRRRDVKQLWNDKPNFMHRAYEFEIAAYFIEKGNSDTRLGEPDIIIPTSRGEHYIACKKLSSEHTDEKYLAVIESHLNKAIEQIVKKSNGTGTVMLEVNENNCSIDEIERFVAEFLARSNGVEKISQVFITWWDRNLTVAELKDREGRVYAARRQYKHVPGTSGELDEIPFYAGETIEWIDTPPICDFRLSLVARSDDWLKTVYNSVFRPEEFIKVGIPEDVVS